MHQNARPTWFFWLAVNACFAAVVAGSSVGLAAVGISISGTPPKPATVGDAWTFTPSVSSAAGTTPRFSITHKPSWASFNNTTGHLSGTPAANDVGTDAGIVISASNGKVTASLAAFAIKVSAVLPTIAGIAAKSVIAGQAYLFKPIATVAAGKQLSFAITNKPTWAWFNSATGALGGTPSIADSASYSNIEISASDSFANVMLPAFAIVVTQIGTKAATLSWEAPTENSDGSPLRNLAGYRIRYGKSKTTLTHTITVSSVGITTYVISNLDSGTYYFGLMAYNSAGVESRLSNIVVKKV